jgi:hypothetical protein
MKFLIPFHDFLNESKLEDIYTKYYADIESDIFNKLISADPTTIIKNGEVAKMGSYSKWLLSLYKNKSLKLEDLYKATNYLTTFDKLKKRNLLSGQQADILSFKSLPELFKLITKVGGTGKPSKDESYLIEDRYFINNDQAEVFFEDSDYLIVIPRTLKASKFYGKDTEWCTTMSDMFKHYTEQGDLYIIIDKRKLNSDETDRRLQFHFEYEEAQFMDMDDEMLTPNERGKYAPYFASLPNAGFILKYDWFDGFNEGISMVILNDKTGYINQKGEVIIPLKYDWGDFFMNGSAVVELNGDYGLVDKEGNEVIPPIYELVGNFYMGRAMVKLNDKYGFVDEKGNVVIPLKYDGVDSFQNENDGRVVFYLDGKWGYVDVDGNESW